MVFLGVFLFAVWELRGAHANIFVLFLGLLRAGVNVFGGWAGRFIVCGCLRRRRSSTDLAFFFVLLVCLRLLTAGLRGSFVRSVHLHPLATSNALQHPSPTLTS